MPQSIRVQCSYGRKHRDITVAVGHCYQVEPLNVLKQKHRGRPCVVLSITKSGKVSVRFLDDNRLGRVDPVDLTELTPASEAVH